jgi:hypothetical protein
MKNTAAHYATMKDAIAKIKPAKVETHRLTKAGPTTSRSVCDGTYSGQLSGRAGFATICIRTRTMTTSTLHYALRAVMRELF